MDLSDILILLSTSVALVIAVAPSALNLYHKCKKLKIVLLPDSEISIMFPLQLTINIPFSIYSNKDIILEDYSIKIIEKNNKKKYIECKSSIFIPYLSESANYGPQSISVNKNYTKMCIQLYKKKLTNLNIRYVDKEFKSYLSTSMAYNDLHKKFIHSNECLKNEEDENIRDRIKLDFNSSFNSSMGLIKEELKDKIKEGLFLESGKEYIIEFIFIYDRKKIYKFSYEFNINSDDYNKLMSNIDIKVDNNLSACNYSYPSVEKDIKKYK
ncbi:MAG: hypothetical protein KFW09_05665 [Oscillospiraceae bacterium]|nr:hypothetical protein [Oscillospiraceae bacterium]